MVKTKKLTLGDVIKAHKLEVLHMPEGGEETELLTKDVSRNGMSLMGYHTLHHDDRINIFGLREVGYIAELSDDERREKVCDFFAAGMPALILTHNAGCDPMVLECAQYHKIPVLRVSMRPSHYAQAFHYFASTQLAPVTYSHGVLVEVFGEGILIMGDSGVGKSEAALELVKKTHRLVADDSVEIKQMPNKQLVGRAPGLTKHFIEIRGLGIINVQNLFGNSAVLDEVRITMAVRFVPWKEAQKYERLGMDEQVERILDVDIPLTTIPVRPGRNLASLVETEAINKRAKIDGYNAANELDRILKQHMTDKEHSVDDNS